MADLYYERDDSGISAPLELSDEEAIVYGVKCCPFCGHDQLLTRGNNHVWFVCMNCHMEGPLGVGCESRDREKGNKYVREHVERAIQTWNDRKGEFSPPTAKLSRNTSTPKTPYAENLKVCPFCAGEELNPDGYSEHAKVVCEKCNTEGPWTKIEQRDTPSNYSQKSIDRLVEMWEIRTIQLLPDEDQESSDEFEVEEDPGYFDAANAIFNALPGKKV